MFHGNVSLEIATGLKELKKRIEAAKIPPSKLDETLNLATCRRRRRISTLRTLVEDAGSRTRGTSSAWPMTSPRVWRSWRRPGRARRSTCSPCRSTSAREAAHDRVSILGMRLPSQDGPGSVREAP